MVSFTFSVLVAGALAASSVNANYNTTTSSISPCEDTYNKCRVGTPGQSGNQAACAAAFVACGGTITAAGTTITGTPSVSVNDPVYRTGVTKTEDITVYTTICPATSVYTSGAQTLTTTYITTSTITSCKGGCAYPTAHPSTCQDIYDKCRVGTPGQSGNQAACLAAFVQCNGTVTIGTQTLTADKTPAPSSTGTSSCEDTYNKCRVGTPGQSGNQASCLADYVQCNGTVTIGTQTLTADKTPAPSSTAAASCEDTYNKCRVGTPGQSGNQASCLADYVQCNGTVTIGSQTFTAATGSGLGSQSAPTVGAGEAATTVETSVVTPSAPSATTDGSSVEFTGAAVANKPLVGGLLALGALAFL